MKHIRLLALTAGLWASTHAGALAATEAPAGWTTAVHKLTVLLSERPGLEALRPAFSDRYASQTLNGDSAELEMLATLLSSIDWVEQLTYSTTPDSLASDIAVTVRTAPLADELKKYLTPGGNQPERAANITAMKWISQQLRPRADQPVAVILAHVPTLDPRKEPHGRVVVILLAGELVGRDQYRVKQVAFGEFAPPR